MKIAILGFARDGQAAYEYFNKPGNELEIRDQNDKLELPTGVTAKLGPDYLNGLDKFDLIVRSAGLLPGLITAANPNSPDILSKVTGNIDEFIKACPSKNIIGVTGTKGKGTTSTLIAKMLKATGLRVHLGGNIGVPALELLKNSIKPDDWIVLEQSSFQLIDQKHSPHIAVCLMVVPEHLDLHADINEYFTAKQQLFANQSTEDVAIYYAGNENSQKIASAGQGQKIPFMKPPGAYVESGEVKINSQTICKTGELKLLGQHNWQNVCAAVTAVWQVTQNVEALRTVLTTFTGLEHRLEFVREVGGVRYYNDSFGTTPETAIVAIQAFDQPKVIILGGSDKGSNYDELAKVVATSNVRKVILIGQMGPKIQAALESAGFKDFIDGGKTMPEIISTARSSAQAGDIVLLSTACASFDLFKDYKDRGEKFKLAVQSLA